MNSSVILSIVAVVLLISFQQWNLRSRALAVYSDVQRLLKNRSLDSIDFFRSKKVQKYLPTASMLERIKAGISLLRESQNEVDLTFAWKVKSQAEKLDYVEKEVQRLKQISASAELPACPPA